ncbi:DUF222 domain-containing protein, partial [Mycolicibacterium litorale]|uniref:HNH endonuclease signature motif containing protein n=1 Tax=Mycolicibacterium litorale TaxID=758802 RepID=UPI003CFAD146
ETHDPGALRRVKDAEKDRGLQFGFISDPAGYMTVWARMYAPDGAAFEQRVHDLAHTLCPDDPRSADERRNDALAAVATGTTLRCECENPDCPATNNEQPTKDVTIHLITTPDTLNHAQHHSTEADAAGQGDGSDFSAECRPADAPQGDVAAECTPAEADDAPPAEEAKEPGAEGDTDDAQPSPAPTPSATPADANADPEPQDDSTAAPTPSATPADENTDPGQRDDSTAAPAPSATPAAAFVIGSGIANAAVVAAFLKRATIRPLKHPGNAPPEPHHRPSAALQDFVRCRDLTCRFPGCDTPAYRCDVDHTVPYPAGPTYASNLKCLCRKHHLLKTFWTGKKGWHERQLADGTLIWTAPSGQTYTTHPGSMLLFPTLCAPTAPAPVQPATETSPDRGLKMPKRRRTRAQDRAHRIQAERKLNDDLVAERNKPPPF